MSSRALIARSFALRGGLGPSIRASTERGVLGIGLSPFAGAIQRRRFSGISTVAYAAAEAAEVATSPGIVGGMLETLQVTTGLPWWATIVGATVSVRLLLSPLNVQMMKTSALLQKIKPQTEKMQAEIRALASAGDLDGAKKKQQDIKNFMQSEGANPLKALLGPVIQLPIFLSMFFGIRRLVQTNNDLHTGGMAWFVDLTMADPTYILPVFCSATMLAVLELGAETGGANSMQNANPVMRNMMRGLCAVSIPVTASFPTALFCYWVPNNVFSLVLALIMRTATVQTYIGARVVPTAQSAVKAQGLLSAVDAGASYSKPRAASVQSTKGVPARPNALLQQRPKGRQEQARRGIRILAQGRLQTLI